MLPTTKIFFMISFFTFYQSGLSYGEPAESCNWGSQKSDKILRVISDNVALRVVPRIKSELIIDQLTSELTATTQYLEINKEFIVTEECVHGDWSRIRVKQPEWLQESHVGWVRSNYLDVKQTVKPTTTGNTKNVAKDSAKNVVSDGSVCFSQWDGSHRKLEKFIKN